MIEQTGSPKKPVDFDFYTEKSNGIVGKNGPFFF
jgi:hypothetical protein